MKIAWFTPFDEKSAIGKVSREICEELGKTAAVDIWCYEREKLIRTNLKVIHFEPSKLDTTLLKEYDAVVYNMGNNAGYHWAIFDVLKQYAGIVLLHDQTLQGFFYMYYCGQQDAIPAHGGEEAFRGAMVRNYGERGFSAANEIISAYSTWDGEKLLPYTVAFPMLQEVFQYADGAFTHAGFFARHLKDTFGGAMGWSYLPYGQTSSKEIPNINSLGIDFSKFILVSNGIVHPVKHIDHVASVLMKNPDLAAKINYVVIGDYGGPYGDMLKNYASNELKGCLHMLGYQPYGIMEAFLRKADACVNLRYPNSEVCSLSLLEQMGLGKPVIVLNSGIFSEVPADSVFVVDAVNEDNELTMLLYDLISNKKKAQIAGRNAKKFVYENCSAQVYVHKFLDFLKDWRQVNSGYAFLNGILKETRDTMKEFGFNIAAIPQNIGDIVEVCALVYGGDDVCVKASKCHCIGLWFGFTYQIPGLYREGISKFMASMVRALLSEYEDVSFEIWTYACNTNDLMQLFDDSLKKWATSGRIKIVSEESWSYVLKIPQYERNLPYDISISKDNLSEIAQRFSSAELFVPAVVYLDNVLGTGKRIFVPVHDMAISYHYDDFVTKEAAYRFRAKDIESRICRMARRGATLFSSSYAVRNAHVMPYVKNARSEMANVVMLPELLPNHGNLALSKDVLSKYNIEKPYLFYPTQLRPYKNVAILLKALVRLIPEFPNIKLVLTGNPEDVPSVAQMIQKLKLSHHIICLPRVSEEELMSLYQYADAVPVPTLMEGSFPAQASEAIAAKAPLVLSRIDVVMERITASGLTADNCGLLLFDPDNEEECAGMIRYAMKNPESVLQAQERFSIALFSYTWSDAARKYHELFFADDIQKDVER